MKEIKFNRNTSFIGRNGCFNQSGIIINELANNEIALSPITGKGQIGRACLTIPKENLIEVITAFCIEFKKYKDHE